MQRNTGAMIVNIIQPEINNVHILPCNTTLDRQAQADKYFEKPIRNQEGHLKTSLLGHDLRGTQLLIPESIPLYLAQTNSNKSDRKLIMQRIQKVTQWNMDQPVQTSNSLLFKINEWASLQQAIHAYD